MKVKIVRCCDSRLWYASRINEAFDVERVEYNWVSGTNYFWVRTGGLFNTINWIKEEDTESVWGGGVNERVIIND